MGSKPGENPAETDSIESISAVDLPAILANDKSAVILDVRKESEFFSEHVVGAEHACLDFVNESMLKISRQKKYYVHCAGGYRSMVFISILKARGFHNLVNINGGLTAIKRKR